MKINFFKLKRNRRYNYIPRYSSGENERGVYVFESKFSKYRGLFIQNNFGQKCNEERRKMRVLSNRDFPIRLMIIFALLALIFLYIIDFDLGIFYNLYQNIDVSVFILCFCWTC